MEIQKGGGQETDRVYTCGATGITNILRMS